MERYLERLIRSALADARAAGLDYPCQDRRAVQEILRSRPDLSDSELYAAVDRVRWEISA